MASSPSCSSSFPSPPGLEQSASATAAVMASSLNEAATEMKARAVEQIAEKFNQLDAEEASQLTGSRRLAVIEAIKEAVLRDVDDRVAGKSEELWQRGRKALNQMQLKQKEKTNRLAEDVAKCHERQRALEAENEKLQQVLTQLASRFQMLGAAFAPQASCANVTGAADGFGCGLGDAQAPAALATPPHGSQDRNAELFAPFTPVPGASNAEGKDSRGDGKLPEVPAFPFPASPAAPLSLAKALGTQTPQRTPLSLANSLTPAPSPNSEASAPHYLAGGCTTFTFTLRKAEGCELGLNVSHHEGGTPVLQVESVRPDGAVEAWNRQCQGTASAEKAVLPGDKITSVNKVSNDPIKMLEECKEKQLLRLTIVRGDYPQDVSGGLLPAKAPSTPSTTKLRADASVFVPMSSGDASALPSDTSSPGDGHDAAQDTGPATALQSAVPSGTSAAPIVALADVLGDGQAAAVEPARGDGADLP
eukprot:CAMPEP_0170603792 /NCGR_PEP_ID=MMETSP0224-20130122/19094_1 /TAXON_ID=285029 /ORGANISM="Togula jolla, Strain CCCM 725" /LENGTH=476 /DNA_ID=CAMNT_0010928683 /DNA_START=100 /DNA_END=1530 /DNA_ORIENTATION=-